MPPSFEGPTNGCEPHLVVPHNGIFFRHVGAPLLTLAGALTPDAGRVPIGGYSTSFYELIYDVRS
jgi:hypothetical protein